MSIALIWKEKKEERFVYNGNYNLWELIIKFWIFFQVMFDESGDEELSDAQTGLIRNTFLIIIDSLTSYLKTRM